MEMNTNAQLSQNPTDSATHNKSLPLSSLLRQSKEAVGTEATQQPQEKKLSALELAKLEKEKGGSGMVMNPNEYQADDAMPEIKHESENEQRTKEFNAAIKELDDMIEVASKVNVKQPTNPLEMAETMDALNDIAKKGELSEENKNAEGTLISTDGSKTFERVPVQTNETDEAEADEIKKAREESLSIIIDKTGLGANIDFTEEERAKMANARLLKLTEVEYIDIKSTSFKAPKKSFLETINEHQIATTMTPVIFPATKIGASMKGLSFGELGEIGLDKETLTFAQLNKKYSIIYNALLNPTGGKFEDYEDFLKRFAYTDIDIAVYGIACSTFPEVDSITLKCNSPECQRMFDHSYSPRSLLRMNELSDSIIKAMRAVTDSKTPEQFAELEQNNLVNKHKLIELPFSKYKIEIGIASAYEYLHSIVDNLLDEKFSKAHPDDVNRLLEINITFLSFIRAIAVPINGEYIRYTDAEDIIQALYTISPDEIQIITNLMVKYLSALELRFALVDVKCPHCGTVTQRIPIDINDLVFMKYQALGNTSLDLEGMLDL